MFNAFISYSHAADDKFAPALQNALQKFAKPWYKKRNLEIYRDESSLDASPNLKDNITKALDNSKYLILLASPLSEKSYWVNKEVTYWLEKKSIDTILIALTEGEMEWDKRTDRFINPNNNSLPPALDNEFASEPFYVDFRQSKTEKDLSLDNPIFKKEILKMAAKLHNKTPNDLASEEVTVHKKMMLLRRLALAIISILFFTAGILGFVANTENKDKIRALEQKEKSDKKTIVALDSLRVTDSLRLLSLEKEKEIQKIALQNEKEAVANLKLAQINQEKAIEEEKMKSSNYLANLGMDSKQDFYQSMVFAIKSDSLNKGNPLALNAALNAYFNKINYRLVEEILHFEDTTYYFNDLKIPNPILKDKKFDVIINNKKISFPLNNSIPNEHFESIICGWDDYSEISDISVMENGRYVKFGYSFLSIILDLQRQTISLVRPVSDSELNYQEEQEDLKEQGYNYDFHCDSILSANYENLKIQSKPYNLHLIENYSWTISSLNNLVLFEKDSDSIDWRYGIYRYDKGYTQEIDFNKFGSYGDFFAFSNQHDLLFTRIQKEHSSQSGEVIIYNTSSGSIDTLNLKREREVRDFQPQNVILSKNENLACAVLWDWEYFHKCVIYRIKDSKLEYFSGFQISEYETPISFSEREEYFITKDVGNIKFYNVVDQMLEFSIPFNLDDEEEIVNLRYNEYDGRLEVQTNNRYQDFVIKKNKFSYEHGLGKFTYGDFSGNEKFLILKDLDMYSDNHRFIIWDVANKEEVSVHNYTKIIFNNSLNMVASIKDSLLTIRTLNASNNIKSENLNVSDLKELVHVAKEFLWYVNKDLFLIRLNIKSGTKKIVDKCYHNQYSDRIYVSANNEQVLYIDENKNLRCINYQMEILEIIRLPNSLFYVINKEDQLTSFERDRKKNKLPLEGTRIYDLNINPEGRYWSYQVSSRIPYKKVSENDKLNMYDNKSKKWISNDAHGIGGVDWKSSSTYRLGDMFYKWNHKPILKNEVDAFSSKNGLIFRKIESNTNNKNRYQITNLNGDFDFRLVLDMGFNKYTSNCKFSKDGNYLFVGVGCPLCYNVPIIIIPVSVEAIKQELLE